MCEPGESSTQQVVNEATVDHCTEVVDIATDDHHIHEQAVTQAAVNQSMEIVTEATVEQREQEVRTGYQGCCWET